MKLIANLVYRGNLFWRDPRGNDFHTLFQCFIDQPGGCTFGIGQRNLKSAPVALVLSMLLSKKGILTIRYALYLFTTIEGARRIGYILDKIEEMAHHFRVKLFASLTHDDLQRLFFW